MKETAGFVLCLKRTHTLFAANVLFLCLGNLFSVPHGPVGGSCWMLAVSHDTESLPVQSRPLEPSWAPLTRDQAPGPGQPLLPPRGAVWLCGAEGAFLSGSEDSYPSRESLQEPTPLPCPGPLLWLSVSCAESPGLLGLGARRTTNEPEGPALCRLLPQGICCGPGFLRKQLLLHPHNNRVRSLLRALIPQLKKLRHREVR